jgi:hypothetical protein
VPHWPRPFHRDRIRHLLVRIGIGFLYVRPSIGHVALPFCCGFRHVALDFGLSLSLLVAPCQQQNRGCDCANCIETHTYILCELGQITLARGGRFLQDVARRQTRR